MSWVLTQEFNDYDQHGAYFVAWFSTKPTVEKLQKVLNLNHEYAQHVYNGGGRIEWEHQWYILQKVKEGVSYDNQ